MRKLFIFACAMLVCAPAMSATVANIQGQTLLNQGSGFRQLKGSAEAGAGAKVLANPGGQAQVTYPDGCTVTVNPGPVYTIAVDSPCKLGLAPDNGLNPYAIGALVVGGAITAVIVSKASSASP